MVPFVPENIVPNVRIGSTLFETRIWVFSLGSKPDKVRGMKNLLSCLGSKDGVAF